MAKHTPGPWRADGDQVRIADGYREFQCVADCSVLVNGEENARLIAAAPELLAALTLTVDTYCETACTPLERHVGRCEAARAAIRKATGDAS